MKSNEPKRLEPTDLFFKLLREGNDSFKKHVKDFHHTGLLTDQVAQVISSDAFINGMRLVLQNHQQELVGKSQGVCDNLISANPNYFENTQRSFFDAFYMLGLVKLNDELIT